MHNPPADPDAVTLIHALNLLAQAWGGTVSEVQSRVERSAVGALVAAGGTLDGTDQAQRHLTEFLLRRDLLGFDNHIRQICRHSTIQESVYPNAGDFERWGFQDDGPLRSAQAAVVSARNGAQESTQAGTLAAIDYAEAMRDYCVRKQNLLKVRTSVNFLGYLSVKKSSEQFLADRQLRTFRPLWQRIVIGVLVMPIMILVVPFTATWWLLMRLLQKLRL
jgi:hypothetical protein